MRAGMTDVLIIGGDSMIGQALAIDLKASGLTVSTTSRRINSHSEEIFFDLAAPVAEWPDLPSAKTWIITAAKARLAACRQDPEKSYRVNVIAVETLAKRAVSQNARVVFLSSNQVFDGRRAHRPVSDATCPNSEYGWQKALAEKIVSDASMKNLVVRLTKVLSPDDALFTSWQGALARNMVITPFTDKTFAPVALNTVCAGIRRAISWGVTGVLQFSGPQDISMEAAAQHLANLMGVGTKHIAPIAAADIGVPAEDRPTFTSLDARRAEQVLGLTFAPPLELIEQTFAKR